ncbi:MAG: D-amino-acid transaminase [Alphaproteobacteria bacterium]|nr:D-amino-acid transaminase [Alphaproteobacteria bacterium]
MSRIVYVNGRYLPQAQARVHIDDRGYQFGDGVYEVCAIRGGMLIDEAPHLKRLERSLGELRIAWPVGVEQLRHVMRETVRRNRVENGLVYVQITRGVARRDHPFPAGNVKPSLVVTARSLAIENYDRWAETGVAAMTLPETRWARCDIKSTSLLANVLAKQQAREAGAFEAWFVDREGLVTEGASTNAWIVDAEGVLRTRRLDHAILPGVTRGEIIPLCRQHGIAFEERAFSVESAKSAREAFVTSASAGVIPVVSIDGGKIGDAKPGPVARALRAAYWGSRQGIG